MKISSKNNTFGRLLKKLTPPALFCLCAGLLTAFTLAFQAAPESIRPGEAFYPPGGAVPEAERSRAAGETTAYKNETVYALLDRDGSLLEQRVVNRIYRAVDPEAALIADYGAYRAVTNMTSGAEPVLKEDRVIWESALLDEGDIYYEGLVEKELPVEFEIGYFLDGKAIDARTLAGKSGRLEIVIKTRNNLTVEEPVSYIDCHGRRVLEAEVNYVPLLVQGTFTADLNRFSNIEATNSSTLVTGQKMSINFMTFPYPEAEITIAMDGEDIELDNIMFVIIPQLPPVTELEMEGELVEMMHGVSALGDALLQLHDGHGQLLHGLEQFRDESNKLLGELEGLEVFLEQLEKLLDAAGDLDDLIGADLDERLAEMIEYIEKLLENLDQLPDPATISADLDSIRTKTEELERRSGSLSGDVKTLRASAALLAAEAEKLIAASEPGSELHALGKLLLAQQEQIERVAAGSSSVGAGIGALGPAVAELSSTWEGSFEPKLQALQLSAEEIRRLLEVILESLKLLQEELARLDRHRERIDDLLAQAAEIYEQLTGLPEALDQMVEGQRQLRDGLKKLHDEGTLRMEKGLIEGINELRYGRAKMDLMRSLADGYRSFVDNEHNRYSDVQFIIQTTKLEKEESGLEEDGPAGEEGGPVSLWSRFLDLFDFGLTDTR